MSRRDRYPGPRPFADDPIDQGLFFGREREAQELCNRILVDPLLVLFGKSGLGKTSLLRAGVFPVLRARDLLPVPVRLNRPEVPLLAAVLEALEQTCQAQGIEWRPVEADDLWTLFKNVVLWRGEALQTPVLVFDQFEEVFTLHQPEARRAFARAIAELLGARLPDSVRERSRAGERLPYGEGPPAVKLVLSLREDHLGALEELAAELPSVLDNRLRLIALDESAARDAVQKPGALPQGEELASPPLRFTEPALTALLGFLKGRSGIIEPFQLQVLCSHLERAGTQKSTNAPELAIDAPELGGAKGMAAVLGDFYRGALNRLPGRWERRRARNLCEWGLLSQDGRRLPMEEAEIRRQYRIGPETLERLVDARLLRSEPRLEGVFYELSHDTLAASALRNRRWRLPRGLKFGLIGLVVLLAAAVLVLSVTEQERRRADEARTEAEGLIDFMVFELRDKLAPIGRLGLMQDLNARVETYYQHLGVKAEDLSIQSRRSAALTNRGNIFLAQGDLPGALASYEEGLAIQRRLAGSEPSNASWQRYLSVSLEKVGDVKAAQGDLAGALTAYAEGKAIRERLAGSDPSNAGWQRDLSVSLDRIGDIKAAQGDLAGALTAYAESKAIRERLAGSDPSNAGWQRDLSVSLTKVGDIKAEQGDLVGALAAYAEGKAISERLAGSDPSNAQWQTDLVISLWKLSQEGMARPEQAIGYLKRAQAIVQQLEAEGRLNAQQKGWAELLRQRLQELESPKPKGRKGKH